MVFFLLNIKICTSKTFCFRKKIIRRQWKRLRETVRPRKREGDNKLVAKSMIRYISYPNHCGNF